MKNKQTELVIDESFGFEVYTRRLKKWYEIEIPKWLEVTCEVAIVVSLIVYIIQ